MRMLRDKTGALPRVPLVLAVGLSLSAGAAGAYAPDTVSPPYGWGLSELSQPIAPQPSLQDKAGLAAGDVRLTADLDKPGPGTRD